MYRGAAYRIDFRPKIVVEWIGDDADVDGIMRAIVKAAGEVGTPQT